MLTKEDNELISQVGPGAPMGRVMREYWLPALLSSELPGTDSDPLRVRMLGEELIAFRDTNGQVGLVGANCPHRGASLFFGRNEECGLRCVYHGWKFDVTGQCVDMPSEPAESNFKAKIKATAYPCRERGGIIWTYMGPLAEPPDLPELEWNLVPAEHRQISKRVQECNWLQALEGGIDSSHSYFLHSTIEREQEMRGAVTGPRAYLSRQKHCHYEYLDTEFGTLWAPDVMPRMAATTGASASSSCPSTTCSRRCWLRMTRTRRWAAWPGFRWTTRRPWCGASPGTPHVR